jgi:hypothetical protein
MKRILICVFVLAMACCIGGCNLINNTSNPANTAYVNKTATFTNALLDSNYSVCINMINLDKSQKSVDMGAVRIGLDSLRAKIGRNFGRQIEYSFMNAQKQASNDMSYNLPPNTTLVSVEFHNTKDIGVLQVLFDDLSGKIDNIQSLQVRQPIPNMTKFWLFGLLALLVVAINIFAIIAAWRSKLKLKWLYCIAIILLNIPSIEYGAAHGLAFRLWRDQYIMGVDFQKIGYLGAFWTIGIPIAAIFTICRVFFFKPKVATEDQSKKPANKKPQPAKGRGAVK